MKSTQWRANINAYIWKLTLRSNSAKIQPTAHISTPTPYILAPNNNSGARYHLKRRKKIRKKNHLIILISSAVFSSNARTTKWILLLTVYFSNTEELQSPLLKNKKPFLTTGMRTTIDHLQFQLSWLTSNRTVDVQRKK